MIIRNFYTDGSANAKGLLGGGWAFCEEQNGFVMYERMGSLIGQKVNSEQMELIAIIEVLKKIKDNESANIYIDSQSIVLKLTRDKKISTKEFNLVFWEELLFLAKDKKINWVWVRAHSVVKFNNYVDSLAEEIYTSKEIDLEKLRDKHLNSGYAMVEDISVGDLIYFNRTDQKYVVVLKNIKVNGELGFIVKMFANYMGEEYLFFGYKNKFNKVIPSKKEKHIISSLIENFKK